MSVDLGFVYRSWLFTPASTPKLIQKAFTAKADIFVLDLEDAVDPSDRPAARRNIAEFYRKNPGIQFGIRINSPRVQDGIKDLDFLLTEGVRPTFIILPKVSNAEEVNLVNELLNDSEEDPIYFIPIIETAEGVFHIHAIANANDTVAGMIFGAADYAADIGVSVEWENMLHARNNIAVAAASAHIFAVDTPCFEIDDLELLESESEKVRGLGFQCKAAIHPSQVPIINKVFAPTAEEVNEAKMIIEAVSGAKGAVVKQGSQLFGPPMVKRAKTIVQLAKASEDDEEGQDNEKRFSL